MNPHNDIAELEGLFEQIASAPATGSSGSSDSETITLTIDKPVVDYGEITLAKFTNIDPIQDILNQAQSQIDQLKNIIASPITPSLDNQAAQVVGQLQTLSSSVASMKVDLSEARSQTTQAPRELKIVSSKGYYSFEIVAGTPTDVHRKPGNSTDSLGTLSATNGTTDGEGKATIIFTPNGNYGKMTFKVKHGNVESD